jgi:tRNA/rRNA methyltransferase
MTCQIDSFSPPVFILVRPQLSENIGTAFRALWNCGLTALRVVSPREPWPQEKGLKAAAGASDQIHSIEVFESLQEAIADLQIVFATTVRHRDLVKPVYPLSEGISVLGEKAKATVKTGILFGTERTGLTSEDLAPTQGILTIPLNPSYNSLNVAQAVLLVAYTWWSQMSLEELPLPLSPFPSSDPLPATHEEFQGFLGHLERALDLSGFLHPPLMRPHMLKNLQALFARAHLTAQEIRTLRGILTSFERLRPKEKT